MENVNDTLFEPAPQNKDIDKLTLELFMNKGMYNKYIQKTDPKAHEEKVIYVAKLLKYRRRILEMTETLIGDPDALITTDVNSGFTDYAKELIKYFDMKSIEGMRTKKYGSEEGEAEEDGDILFSNMEYMPVPTSSFWSKERITKLG
jgi:hypothetical protein